MLTDELGLQRVTSMDGPLQATLDHWKTLMTALQTERDARTGDVATFNASKRESDLAAMFINLDLSGSRFHLSVRVPEEESEAVARDITEVPDDASSDDDEDDDEAATKRWAVGMIRSLLSTKRAKKVERGIDTLYSGLKSRVKEAEVYQREGLKQDIETANEKLEKYFERYGPLPTDATGGTEDSFVMSPLSRKATEQPMTGSTAPPQQSDL